MSRARSLFIALAPTTALLLADCKPDFGSSDSLVASPRILAVRVDPPEAVPGTQASYTALVATPGATLDAAAERADVVWRFCTAPTPVGENNVVSTACLDPASLVPAGGGLTILAATPKDACSRFGPDTPPGGFRPRDPDATGGYYQPLRLDLAGAGIAFALARVTCNLTAASADTASAFAAAYTPNANPHLLPIVATVGDRAIPLDALPAGARVNFEASWAGADAETYAYFDATSQSLATKRESIRVAWFATAGSFDSESTGRAEDDLTTTSDNAWVAPSNSGAVRMWVVLRDGRGGVDFAAYELAVIR